ncbi:unnamed protein product [Adineta ricciae]|uniref:Uncharacterized protein n=1 Tax=Adineta ricciae TaxID=249248 RepID=A0A814JSC0_ADIRI|nr:unnamed protein product [Adineta ricciae]
MSQEPVNTAPDQLPSLPETTVIEPVVQCGVLYLGTAVPSPGRRGIDSIQEPFAHRYPVDGTNTARGIDSVLSVYENGIQLTFARQPHTVIFFPISSLIYCASLRFSVIEDDQTSSIDWRFVTLDSTMNIPSKHPPLFCLVVHRTQILIGDECHCFITKNDVAALALVRAISDVYANLPPLSKPLRSPIFYQLDRYGRKISETTGVIYLSPANEDESQINQLNERNTLLDPSLNGFFYRTDGNLLEQWQLWDDDDVAGTRPRPPPSPFGQNQALYHDDVTQEIHKYLRHMDDEDRSSSCSCSSSSSSSDISNRHHHRRRLKSKYDHVDQLNAELVRSQTSSFDPTLPNNIDIKPVILQQTPIIIEKVVPNSIVSFQQKQPSYIFPQSILQPPPLQECTPSYATYSDTYQINEHGERITTDGNRILFMDVIQPNAQQKSIEPTSYITQPVHRAHSQRRRSKPIPVVDLQSIEKLFNERKSKQRRASLRHDQDDSDINQLTTSDMLDIVEGYFEDYRGRKLKLNGHDAQAMIRHLESSSTSKKKNRQESDSSNKQMYHEYGHRRRRQHHSTIKSGPSINYVERSQMKLPSQQSLPARRSLNNEQVDEYVSSIYGSSEKAASSIKSSTSHQHTQANAPESTLQNQEFISPFRYMQSSINPLLLQEYRQAYGGI